AHALGADQVTGIAMPSRYSSDHSIEDARNLARNLGTHFHLVPIDPMHGAFDKSLTPLFDRIVADPSVGLAGVPRTQDQRMETGNPIANRKSQIANPPVPAADLTDQ